ncbi:hypothetical protein, partial [Bradyrhizobium sp. 146]|uniref:hypothetical protein n=1 Tax=Bradyrhizobium sp. 146 TaxID=2782622 RepID=UPI001FF95334
NPHTSSHGPSGAELTRLPLNAPTSNQKSNCNASPISKIASRGHARNITNAMKARLTEGATTAQQQIVAGENSRASCEVSTQSGGIQVSSKDAG